MTNYDTARFFAISSIGYGKGFTPGEAHENYVTTQLRNYPATTTIFGTRKKWETALRTGDAKADVWFAPEGTTGFVIGMGLQWTDTEGKYTQAQASEKLAQDPTDNQKEN